MLRAGALSHGKVRGIGALVTDSSFLVGADEWVEVAVEYAFRITCFVVRAVVLHHLIRMEYVGPDLIAPAGGDVLAFEAGVLLGLLFELLLEEAGLEDFESDFLVPALRALVLTGDNEATRYVRDADRCRVLLDVLAAVAAGAKDIDAQVVRVDADLRDSTSGMTSTRANDVWRACEAS